MIDAMPSPIASPVAASPRDWWRVRRVGAADLDQLGIPTVDDAAIVEEKDEEAAAAARGYSRCFNVHRSMLNGRNAAWLGSRGQYVVSGTDDGALFVWAADSGQLVTVLRGSGDKAVRRVQVCVQAG
jgi:hypothetical protein